MYTKNNSLNERYDFLDSLSFLYIVYLYTPNHKVHFKREKIQLSDGKQTGQKKLSP